MSFLSDNHSEYLSARITQKGRNAIAKGNFKIDYFQIGDSEFDYSNSFTGLTGTTTHQKVFSPLDYNTNVKYPLGFDSNFTTTYGVPTQFADPYTIRNVMGPAGVVSPGTGSVSGYTISGSITGTTIHCVTSSISPSSFNGSNTLTVLSTGSLFEGSDFVTIVLNNLTSSYVTQNPTSLIYKVTGITGSVLYLDRGLPVLSGISGTVISNKCEIEYPDIDSLDPETLPAPIDTEGQLNPWTLNTVWSNKPIGSDYNTFDENLNGYESNRFVSTKDYLGYTTTGQTFSNLSGNIILFASSSINIGSISSFTGFSSTNIGTAYLNSYQEYIEVPPSEQRCIAIIHYSELGDTIADPERFFKYDDYISHSNATGSLETVATEYLDEEEGISDTEYFEVFIPFIKYHRNTGSTIGAKFVMDTKDFYLKSSSNINESRFELKFRYLLDENHYMVGKVFVNNKIIVFDDQELVAMLDYRSNRRFTLPAPRVNVVPSDLPSNSLIPGSTSLTYWVTYMLSNSTGSSIDNYLPCNYFNKIEVNYDTGSCNVNYSSNISFKFNTGSFDYLGNDIQQNYTAKHLYALIQSGNTQNTLPSPNTWQKIYITGSNTDYLSKTTLQDVTFVITKDMYSSGSSFDLESFMSGSDYLGISGPTDYNVTKPQFGDEQPFPGSVKVVRATDVEQMNFLINLPTGKFTTSQNPTSGSLVTNPMITEVALLDSGKNPLVIAKAPTPLKRTGTQVFSVKLDF